jgi:hypothetical protein
MKQNLGNDCPEVVKQLVIPFRLRWCWIVEFFLFPSIMVVLHVLLESLIPESNMLESEHGRILLVGGVSSGLFVVLMSCPSVSTPHIC